MRVRGIGRRSATPPYSTAWATLPAADTSWSGFGTRSMRQSLRPLGRPDALAVGRAPRGQLGEEALRPGVDVVLRHGPAHRLHPPGRLLRLGTAGLEQGGLHAVDVVGVDQPGLA